MNTHVALKQGASGVTTQSAPKIQAPPVWISGRLDSRVRDKVDPAVAADARCARTDVSSKKNGLG